MKSLAVLLVALLLSAGSSIPVSRNGCILITPKSCNSFRCRPRCLRPRRPIHYRPIFSPACRPTKSMSTSIRAQSHLPSWSMFKRSLTSTLIIDANLCMFSPAGQLLLFGILLIADLTLVYKNITRICSFTSGQARYWMSESSDNVRAHYIPHATFPRVI